MKKDEDASDLARLALAETADAIKVLSEGALAASAEPGILSARANLVSAKALLQTAQNVKRPVNDEVFQQATSRLRAARSSRLNSPRSRPTAEASPSADSSREAAPIFSPSS